MTTVHDVAAYIVSRLGPISAMKLEKLVYYSQAWHLAWEDAPLFEEDFQAWPAGPVVPELYTHHRGKFTVPTWPWGDRNALTEQQREDVDAVLRDYGSLNGNQLSVLTHKEAPWRNAREGLGSTERSNNIITKNAMQAYYLALSLADDSTAVSSVDWSPWGE